MSAQIIMVDEPLLTEALAGESDLYAGHKLTSAFLDEVETASLAPVTPLRTVRLASDAADAEARIDGPPLWRRAEPGEDAALSAALAADLANWVRTCAASCNARCKR